MSNYILPIIILIILITSIKSKSNIYDDFLSGAFDGLKIMLEIIPSILAMVFAVNIFLKSGILNTLVNLFINLFNIKIPFEILSMALLRPISGTASLAILNNIFTTFGPDSFISILASTMQGCTDTTIYVLALYFGSVKITKSRYALGVGLFADLIGIIASVIIVSLFFG